MDRVGTYTEDRCAICLESFSQDPDHKPSALECGHVFGRSCILEWEERDPGCPICRQYLSPLEEAPDDSFTTELRNEFRKCLDERKITSLVIPFLMGFLTGPDPEMLFLYNKLTITMGCAFYVIARGNAAVNRLMSKFFNFPPPAADVRLPSLQKIAAHFIIPYSAFTTGFICSRLTQSLGLKQ